MQQAAARLHVTLNTILQTSWGILLQRYNNTGDVVFGVVVSGRPSELKDLDQTVGLFINTVPVRVKTGTAVTFSQLLKEIQQSTGLAQRYSYPLSIY